MKIPKRSEMTTRAVAGRKAKKDGHEFEHRLAATFDELFGGDHKVDGRPCTKVDIMETISNRKYSVKSASKNHTQVALLSAEKFIKHFKLKGTHSETFIRQFFGYPNKECVSIVESKHPEIALSDAEKKQNRIYRDNIDKKVSNAFLKWINKNKVSLFDVIVTRGFEGDAVDTVIWHKKGSEMIRMMSVVAMLRRIEGGKWTMNNTTLEFRDEDGKKMFHLQMKGSGKKYNSGYHGMMFHLHV